MHTNRIIQLLKFIEEDPKDTFSIYALALEYDKLDLPEAEKYYTALLTDFPDYLPVYYHAGKYFEKIQQAQKAIEIYNTGIELAQKQNQVKAGNELKNAKMMLEDELFN